MQLKKLIPAFLALIVLCGCSSGSNDSTKKDNIVTAILKNKTIFAVV